MRPSLILLVAAVGALVVAAPAGAFRLGHALEPVADNPPIIWSTSRPIPRSASPPRPAHGSRGDHLGLLVAMRRMSYWTHA